MCISLLKFVVKMGLNMVEELFKRAWGQHAKVHGLRMAICIQEADTSLRDIKEHHRLPEEEPQIPEEQQQHWQNAATTPGKQSNHCSQQDRPNWVVLFSRAPSRILMGYNCVKGLMGGGGIQGDTRSSDMALITEKLCVLCQVWHCSITRRPADGVISAEHGLSVERRLRYIHS